MIRLADKLWIGIAHEGANVAPLGIGAVLNVAQDLRSDVGWPDVEYMQVGLVDGPGNPPAAYCAAVLALAVLLDRHRVLVCCHEGGRSVAVSVMYLELTATKGWNEWLDILNERTGIDLPVPHAAHWAAFEKIDWQALRKLAGNRP